MTHNRHPFISTTVAIGISISLAACPSEDTDAEDPSMTTSDGSTGPASTAESTGDLAGDSTGEPTPADGTTTGEPPDVLACDEDFVVGIPLFGPGIDPETGEVVTEQNSYVVSTTQFALNDNSESREQFDMLVGAIIPQLMATEGLIGMSFGGEMGCGFQRTLSIWEDTAAMYAFVSSGAHAEAIPQTPNLGWAARVTHWDHDAAEGTPTWEQALARIDEVAPIVYE